MLRPRDPSEKPTHAFPLIRVQDEPAGFERPPDGRPNPYPHTQPSYSAPAAGDKPAYAPRGYVPPEQRYLENDPVTLPRYRLADFYDPVKIPMRRFDWAFPFALFTFAAIIACFWFTVKNLGLHDRGGGADRGTTNSRGAAHSHAPPSWHGSLKPTPAPKLRP